ncbi:MAG: hypothetical protein L3J10_08070 [Sulfurimonas sp.]|nr:hypothetical protein [Sulfurimonas sp.]
MERFIELELAFMVVGAFFLAITAFVTSRDFVPKGSFKTGMSVVGGFVVFMILTHYYVTTSRIAEVKESFYEGEIIICENKMRRTIARSVLLSLKLGWDTEGDLFTNPNYERDFHISRCLKWIGNEEQIESEKNDRFDLDKEKV